MTDPAITQTQAVVTQMFGFAPPDETGGQGVIGFRPHMPWTWDTTKITNDMTWPRRDATVRLADGWF